MQMERRYGEPNKIGNDSGAQFNRGRVDKGRGWQESTAESCGGEYGNARKLTVADGSN
jgi:hypothetical protein